MNKKKQIGIIVVLVLIIGAIVIIPMLREKESIPENELSSKLTIPENLSVTFGEKFPVNFEILNDKVVATEIYFNDSLLKTWEKPKGKISFTIDFSGFGLGSKTISLISKLKNGEEETDSRLISILSDEAPKELKASVVKSYIHNSQSFTQGLEFNEGILFESTGLNGKSKIAQVELESGIQKKEIALDANHFGEGITIFGNKVYQITWQNQKCFVYDKNTLQLEKNIDYTGEGWGLCNDGKSIIMSNGTETITFRNPETFQIEKIIEVYDNVGPRAKLNELEYINGKIYANVWMLDIILEIDPKTGKVLSEIDCSEIVKVGKGNGEALNGIAYNTQTNKLYLTGKNWSNLLEVQIK